MKNEEFSHNLNDDTVKLIEGDNISYFHIVSDSTENYLTGICYNCLRQATFPREGLDFSSILDQFANNLLEKAKQNNLKIGITIGLMHGEQFEEILFDTKSNQDENIKNSFALTVLPYLPPILQSGTKKTNSEKLTVKKIILESNLTAHIADTFAEFRGMKKAAIKDYFILLEKKSPKQKTNLLQEGISFVFQISLFEVINIFCPF